jgi:hypothetical protein
MPTPNETLAGSSGQDATHKEPLDAERAAKGEYACPITPLREGGTLAPSEQPKSTVNPTGGAK